MNQAREFRGFETLHAFFLGGDLLPNKVSCRAPPPPPGPFFVFPPLHHTVMVVVVRSRSRSRPAPAHQCWTLVLFVFQLTCFLSIGLVAGGRLHQVKGYLERERREDLYRRPEPARRRARTTALADRFGDSEGVMSRYQRRGLRSKVTT